MTINKRLRNILLLGTSCGVIIGGTPANAQVGPLLVTVARSSFTVRGVGIARDTIRNIGGRFIGGAAEAGGAVVGGAAADRIVNGGRPDQPRTLPGPTGAPPQEQMPNANSGGKIATNQPSPATPRESGTSNGGTPMAGPTLPAARPKRLRLVTLRDDQWRIFTPADHCYIDEDINQRTCHPCAIEMNNSRILSCNPTGTSSLEIDCVNDEECKPSESMMSAIVTERARLIRAEKLNFMDRLRCDNRRDYENRENLPWAKVRSDDEGLVPALSYPGISAANRISFKVPSRHYVKIIAHLSGFTPPPSMPNASRFLCVSIIEKESRRIRYGLVKSEFLENDEPSPIEKFLDRDKL